MPTVTDDDQQSRIDEHYHKGQGSYNPRALDGMERDSIPGYNYNDGIDENGRDLDKGNPDPSRNITSANDREQNPSWTTKYTGKNQQQQFSGKGRFKKKGPIAALVALLLGGGVGLSFFSTQGLLLVHLKEAMVEKFDTQSISMTARTNRMIAAKITNSATEGSCDIVKVACRFSRPSNRLLAQLDKAGITALDKDGKPIVKRSGLFPNKRPAKYLFVSDSGKHTVVAAKDFSKTLRTNVEFRAAFHQAFNPRFAAFADSVYGKILARFGFSKADTLRDAKTTKDVDNQVNERTAGTDNGLQGEEKSPKSQQEDALKDEIKNEADKEIKGRLGYSKGDVITLIGGTACLVSDMPGLIVKSVRAYHMAQLIRYAALYLVTADAIKAGTATPTEVSALSAIMTTVTTNMNGKVINKAATDSFGIKYTLFGDTALSSQSPGHDYNHFAPGGGIAAALGPVASVSSSSLKNNSCKIVNSPAVQAAISAVKVAICSTGVGCVASALDEFTSLALGFAVGYGIQIGLPLILHMLPMDKIVGYFLGDLTKNIVGEDAGNAYASGAAHLMGQTANAGANMPMSVDDALAYEQTANQINVAYAQEDRATLSPFDASSPNTFVGSIYTQFIPYMSELSSVSGTLGFIGNLFSRSFGMMFTPSFADSTASQRAAISEYCSDKSIANSDVAVGPFCNVIYGIPPQYLNKDTMTVLHDVSDQIDPDTGDPLDGSDMKAWLDMCTTGDSVTLADCKITDEQHADYALYTIDHRIQKDQDGEDQGTGSGNASPDTGGNSTPTNSSDVTWPLDMKWWNNNKADFLNAHTLATGTAWGADNMGTTNKGAGIAADIGLPVGTKVYAMVGGTVTSTNLCGANDGIAIKSTVNGKTLGIAYMHGNHQQFKVGQTVNAGDYIMDSGEYGCNVYGPHLHLGMAYNGKYLCPQDVFLALSNNQSIDWSALTNKANPGCGRI